jgi:hypothetical protein
MWNLTHGRSLHAPKCDVYIIIHNEIRKKGLCWVDWKEIYACRKAQGMNLLPSFFMKQKPKELGEGKQVALYFCSAIFRSRRFLIHKQEYSLQYDV